MKTTLTIFTCFLFLCLSASCKKLVTPEKAIVERENWYQSFDDSIKYYEDQYSQIDDELRALNQKISESLQEFEMVNNAREVEGYYLIKGWKDKVPLTSTGIYARLNINEGLELIATLSGATFNQISVGNVVSQVVPHDQALNYRHGKYNTVYFTGIQADSVAQYIAENAANTLKLNFMESGKKRGELNITQNEKDMISKTWKVYHYEWEIKKYQNELMLCTRKIDTFRRYINQHKEQKNQ